MWGLLAFRAPVAATEGAQTSRQFEHRNGDLPVPVQIQNHTRTQTDRWLRASEICSCPVTQRRPV